MQLEQVLRRVANRVRRRLIGGGADNEPVVEIEGAPKPAPKHPPLFGGWRRRIWRLSKSTIAFVITLIVLAAAFFTYLALQSRLPVDLDGPSAEGPEKGSKAVAAAAALLSVQSEMAGAGDDTLFLPTERQRRAAEFQDGAGEAVSAFVEVVERRRPGRDGDLSEAEDRLSESADPARYAVARDALRRFNARDAARDGPPVDASLPAYAAAARAAAAASAAHSGALAKLAQRLEAGRTESGVEDAFMRARGQAFAWRRLLLAYAEDVKPEERADLAKSLGETARLLGDAASYEPTVVLQVRPGAPLGPASLNGLSAKLDAATKASRELAEAAER